MIAAVVMPMMMVVVITIVMITVIMIVAVIAALRRIAGRLEPMAEEIVLRAAVVLEGDIAASVRGHGGHPDRPQHGNSNGSKYASKHKPNNQSLSLHKSASPRCFVLCSTLPNRPHAGGATSRDGGYSCTPQRPVY